MSRSRKFSAGEMLIVSIVTFAYAGSCMYKAMEFTSGSPSERTATAHDILIHPRNLSGNSCTYRFSVDGTFYSGRSDCPKKMRDAVFKGKSSYSAAAWPAPDATIYYDPGDPSVNSLLEFSTASRESFGDAAPWAGLGALSGFIFILRRPRASNDKGDGEVVVDARERAKLRELYLEAVDEIHPHRAANEADLALRLRLMEEANAAFECGEAETLRRVLEECRGTIPPASNNKGDGGVDSRGRVLYPEESNFAGLPNREAAKSAPSSKLRELYLEVVNKIHPDRAANEADLALRERLMKEANAAFKRGDAETLRRVLEEYSGAIPVS